MTVWYFDYNRRVYSKPGPDRAWGQLIWREHWREVEVTGETARSYVTAFGKMQKKGANPRQWLFTEAEVDEMAWAEEHRHKVARFVERWDLPTPTLRQVAAIVGYKEQP